MYHLELALIFCRLLAETEEPDIDQDMVAEAELIRFKGRSLLLLTPQAHVPG